MSSSSSSTIAMATTTASSTSSPAPSSSPFPVTISPLNALSTAFPPANLTIHSTPSSRSDAKDLSQPLPQHNKKQSTPITPLGIIKPIISITPVGSSASPTNSSSSNKSQSTSLRNNEDKSKVSSSSSSKNPQGKGSKLSERNSRASSQETVPPNPFMSFMPPLSYLGNGNPANDLIHLPLAKFFPTPELLCNPFALKSKCDASNPHAILSLEKLSKMNEKRLRSSQSQDLSKALNRFLPAPSDMLYSPFASKTKNNIPHAALSLVTNGKHERSGDRDSKCHSAVRRKWSPKSGGSDEERKCASVDGKITNRHFDRHHARSGEQESLRKGIESNSHQGLGVSLSDSITLTPVSPTSPSNAPLNLSLKPAPATETNESAPQSLHSIPQLLAYKGAKRGPKQKPFSQDDWQKLSQRQEQLQSQMEAHLMQQHFKLNKSNVNKAHQGNNAIPLLPPEILVQTKINQDNSIVITTSSNESHKSHLHSSPNANKDSNYSTSRAAVSLLSPAGLRYQDFPSTSVNERVPSPRTSSQSPSRVASNGTGSFPLFLYKNKDSREEKTAGADRFEVISTDDSTGSSEDSESGSESESSNESDRSSSGSDKSRETSSSKGQKRESSGDSPPRKRRKYIVSDERELRIPLEHGWRRLTKIRAYSYSGVRGEVIYYGPCGKKLKTYPEVVRYLEKNGIDDITRDNFTFSSKHNVGEFLEPLGNGEYVTIGENEVISRIEEFRAHKSRRYVPVSERSERGSGRESRRSREERMRQLEEARLQQQLEEQAEESALDVNKRPERLRRAKRKAVTPTKQVKEKQAAEMRRQREHVRFLKMQEKIDRQEQLRVEREVRAQQLFEERKRRQDLLERQRSEEAMRKNKEKESKRLQAVVLKEQELQKRREMLVIVDLERERRRQHMLLVKALEARKKQEERDRMKEEKILEKQIQRERKMEQRQIELHILREMKKPVEDMELKDIESLPALDRIPGVKLAGKAFADTLMVFEFLHNFGEALGFDMDSLPTLNTLQMAVLNDESCEEELLSLLHHLLICAIEDPGIPAGAKTSTAVGQSLKEMDITSTTISEVLRIYIHANEGEKSQYLEWISRKPFLALNPTQKAAILAYLCNELLCSKTIIRQIDNNIEGVNNMRRDRWVVEGKVRNLKLIQTRKVAKQMIMEASKVHAGEGEKAKGSPSNKGLDSTPVNSVKKDEARNDSGNESEGSHEISPVVGDNEQIVEEAFQGESVEELGKQIDKLVKQQNQFRKKLQKTSQQIRAISFGQDRYRRRYWLLPHAGGIFVEGVESSEPAEDLPAGALSAIENNPSSAIKEEKVEIPQVKQEPKEVEETEEKVNETTEKASEAPVTETEHPKMDVDLPLLNKPTEIVDDLKLVKSEPTSNDDVKTDDKTSVTNAEVKSDAPNEVKSAVSSNSEENLLAVPQCHINAEKILKTLEERTLKPWFSILPRMPCDETSLTRIHSAKTLNSPTHVNNSLGKHSSDAWASPVVSGQPAHHSLSGSSVLPHFMSSAGVLPGGNMHFNSSPLTMEMFAAITSSPLYLLSRNNSCISSFSSPSFLNESDAFFCQFKQTPAELQPIPQEFQNGWWRITDPNQLRTLHQRLHSRGIREKLLQMKLEKYMDIACEACTKTSQVADLEITDLDREISQKPGGSQEADNDHDWSWSMALRVDLAILEQVENLEEKVVNASMQNKHWKLPTKSTEDEDVVFYPACGNAEECIKRETKEESHDENKIYRCPLTTARHRLLELEENIERRYIKPPLGYGNNDVSITHPKHHHNSSLNTTNEMYDDVDDQNYVVEVRDVPEGLLRWRAAVQNARTSSQLAVCLNYLESCIAWDRSIMKACCQFCLRDDNEAMLLLCDGCDKGYHTYCFKPKMETIPDGDWFCFECVNKATGDRVCIVCGKKGKNMCICDSCPKAYHTDCLEPPLSRTPKSRWLCPHCKHRTAKGKTKSKKGGGKEAKDGSDQEETQVTKKNEKPKSDQRAKEKNKVGVSKDLAPCRSLLADLETHEDAWPFLLPVNTKLFPSYRKVIRKPVDLSTIRSKLENGSYKTRSDFMNDVQLIFKNCETFNEDDSPVGKAGHSLRAFFESRWSDLIADK